MFCTVGQNYIFEIFRTKCHWLRHFFTDCDENLHEGPALDAESESNTNLDENGHEGPSSDGKSESVLILKFFLHSESKNWFF